MRRSVLSCLVATSLVANEAHASNDGQLCNNPVGFVLCSTLMLVDALRFRSWAERMEDAARAGNVAELKLLVTNHPGSVDALNLLVLAVGSYYPYNPATADRGLEMFAFLLESGVNVADPRMTDMLETIASKSVDTRRIDVLNLWFAKGVSARGVSLATRTIGWGPEGPGVIRLLVQHGADPNYRRPGQQSPVAEALSSHDEATARLLIELGAERPPGF